jgi:hypothetical protein
MWLYCSWVSTQLTFISDRGAVWTVCVTEVSRVGLSGSKMCAIGR